VPWFWGYEVTNQLGDVILEHCQRRSSSFARAAKKLQSVPIEKPSEGGKRICRLFGTYSSILQASKETDVRVVVYMNNCFRIIAHVQVHKAFLHKFKLRGANLKARSVKGCVAKAQPADAKPMENPAPPSLIWRNLCLWESNELSSTSTVNADGTKQGFADFLKRRTSLRAWHLMDRTFCKILSSYAWRPPEWTLRPSTPSPFLAATQGRMDEELGIYTFFASSSLSDIASFLAYARPIPAAEFSVALAAAFERHYRQVAASPDL